MRRLCVPPEAEDVSSLVGCRRRLVLGEEAIVSHLV